ncbi:MAG: hypothetical protein IKN55_10630 [Oscillospiraceae bacterium]|nr:hypothetical protein [Oscillospiraceae bacterium]
MATTSIADKRAKLEKKIAGYARVSTDSDEQQTSYEAQVFCDTEYIRKRADWGFAGVYTDMQNPQLIQQKEPVRVFKF